MFNRRGTYSPTREQYPLMDSLAVAVAVDRAQGFVKSKQGFMDPDQDIRIDDNRVTALRTLRQMNGTPAGDDHDGKPLAVYIPTKEDRAAAQDIFSHFDEILLMDKLGDNLVKVGKDGRRNDFNESLSTMFGKPEIDVAKELAMLVSLPNSRRTSDKRQAMQEFYDTHRENGYIGAMKDRLKVTGHVLDVKPIPKHSIHLATVVTTDNQIAKFFMNDKLSDVAQSITGTDITFVGTVKKHEINSFTNCQETMFNRIKLG